MKVLVITNLRTELSVSVISALQSSSNIALSYIVFCDRISLSKNRAIKLLKQNGIKKVAKKCIKIADLKLRLKFHKLFSKYIRKTSKYSYEYAIKSAIPYSIVNDINSRESIDIIDSDKPDIILVCSCSQILSKQVIELSNKGTINVHPSLLPRHRGPVPSFWVLFMDEKKSGCTFHMITEKIDNGNILAQYEYKVGSIKSEERLTKMIFDMAGTKVEDVIMDIMKNKIIPIRQNTLSIATYESYPTTKERKLFYKKGYVD